MLRYARTLAIVATIATSALPAARTAQAQTPTDRSSTPTPAVKGEEIAYRVGDVELTGYLAYDANRTAPRPGILVVHEWWGHNEYVRRRVEQLAAMGYTALALDMYGDGKLATHPEDARAFMMKLICQKTGGPCAYLGRPMPVVHTGLGISAAQWSVFMTIITDGMHGKGYSPDVQAEFLEVWRGFRDEVVEPEP